MRTRQAEAFWYEPLHRWQINVQRAGLRKTFTDSTPGKKGKHLAEAKADKWLERYTTDQSITSAVELFLEDKKRRLAESTYIQYDCKLRAHVLGYFPPSKRLSAITAYDWQQVVDHAEGLTKASSQKMFIALINQFIGYCKSRRWEIEEPFLQVNERAGQSRERKALTADAIAALLAYPVSRCQYANFFKLAVLTGCRRGELLALRWDDVQENSLRIRKGKTANATRQVPLIPQAVTIIDDIRARAQTVSKLVFCNKYGEKVCDHSINDAWAKIKQDLGLDGYTIHELRHTFISVCKGQVNMVLLKKAIGHSASMDTVGVYGHTIEQDIADTAAETASAFDRIIK